MNVLEKKDLATTACLVLGLSMLFSAAVASAAAPSAEELMAEGISFPSPTDNHKAYCGDTSIPSAEEMTGEGIIEPEVEQHRKYSYDSAAPSADEMMSEDECLRAAAGQTKQDERSAVAAIGE